MKVLMVSWSVLPKKGGSSIIVENLAKNFSTGEMVVLGSRKLWQNTKIQRSVNGPKFCYFFSELDLFGRGSRFFSWFAKWRFPALVRAIKSLIRQEGIDHVIGVYPNEIYCHAACIAAQETNTPFSAYFHNTYTENLAINDPRAPAIQEEIFNQARLIFVMSKGMQKFYEKKYGLPKFVPLVHTFNEYPPKTETGQLPKKNKKHYKLVAIGNFNESNLEATRRFVKAVKTNPKYTLYLYTHVPKMLLWKRGIDLEAVHHQGFVRPDQIHQVLQEYDVCVLTHGFKGGYGEIEYQTIFPTRTIPLLLSGKPIIAHSPPGSFLNNFISENHCAELVSEPSQEAILQGLERITNDGNYQNQLLKASRQAAKQFYGPLVVNNLKRILAQNS